MRIIFLFVLCILILPYNFPSVKAHESQSSKWLIINNEFLLEENLSQNTSALFWADHIIDGPFDINAKFNFKIATESFDEEVVAVFIELKSSNAFAVNINGDSVDARKRDDYFYTDIREKTFELEILETGAYFFELSVFGEDSTLGREEFSLMVGNPIKPSALLLDNKLVSEMNIRRAIPVSFEINEPDFENYKYFLDFGDGEIAELTSDVNQVSKRFNTTKLPVFPVLRKEDKITKVFADYSIKIDSDEESDFEVVPPNVQKPDDIKTTSNLLIYIGLATILLIVGSTIVYRRRRFVTARQNATTIV